MAGVAEPRDDLDVDRQLGGGAFERDTRGLAIDTVEFEQDAARLDPGDPEFGRALARAHPHFGGLRRHRYIREDADPQAALTLDMAGDRATRGLDLPGGDPLGL